MYAGRAAPGRPGATLDMKPLYLQTSSLALALALVGPAQAVSPQTAEAVVAVLKQVPRPTRSSTDFEKWAFDTLGFTALSCWRGAHPSADLPAALKGPLYRSGTFSSPDDGELERLCTSLASHGFTPWCVTASVHTSPKIRDTSLPRDYLQFDSYTAHPAVSGGLYCHLSKDIVLQQFFVPDQITARWDQVPRLTSFMTHQAERRLKSSSLLIEVPTARDRSGRPFAMPMTAVVPN